MAFVRALPAHSHEYSVAISRTTIESEFCMRSSPAVSRRAFLSAASLSAVGTLVGCALPSLEDPGVSGSARLTARPGTPTTAGPLGLHPLGLFYQSVVSDGVVYVPASYAPESPAPLVLLLHGARGSGADFVTRRIPEADRTGQILVAPDARSGSWDWVFGSFGSDIGSIDAALRDTFSRYAIDTHRVAVAGFSDGATLSLALGIANGDLFTRTVAWSPGQRIGRERSGNPLIYISHGTQDAVLPIQYTSRPIVSDLRRQHYQVTFREFEGAHGVPDDVLHEAMTWMAA